MKQEIDFFEDRDGKISGESVDVRFAKILDDYLNGGSYRQSDLIEYLTKRMHRYLQSQLFNLCWKIINAFAELEDRYIDGRNEGSCKAAKEIVRCYNEHGWK